MNICLIAYPGGKTKLAKHIVKLIDNDGQLEYREPFFGSGSVGLEYLMQNPHATNIWINDLDPGIAALWSSVMWFPNELKQRINEFRPSLESFDEFKKELLAVKGPVRTNEYVNLGFKKLAVHRMTFGALGTKASNPYGGRNPQSPHDIARRWKATRLCDIVDVLHNRLQLCNIRHSCCSSLDFANLIHDDSRPSVIYLDPPYWNKSEHLYQCGFDRSDHIRLAGLLQKTGHSWVLSYDDSPHVRELYKWAHIREMSATYSIARRKTAELLIMKPDIEIQETGFQKFPCDLQDDVLRA